MFEIAIVIFAIFTVLILVVKLAIRPRPKSIKNLHKKFFLITGGTKGIGRSLAEQCVSQGAHVTIVARNSSQLERAKFELEKMVKFSDQQVKILALDLTCEYSRVEKALDECLGSDPVDFLVNNAGGAIDGSFDQLEGDIFEQQMRLNFLSAAHVTKACINRIKNGAMTSLGGSRVVFLSSQAGQLGLYGYTAYSASKFALRGFAESLQMELKPYNVWVTVAYPPNTDTEGYATELLHIPDATRLISGTSGLMRSEDVARQLLHDACRGRFCSHFGLDGWMLSVLCCGMSPETNVVSCLQQIFLTGIFRLISLFHLKNFHRIVVECDKCQKH